MYHHTLCAENTVGAHQTIIEWEKATQHCGLVGRELVGGHRVVGPGDPMPSARCTKLDSGLSLIPAHLHLRTPVASLQSRGRGRGSLLEHRDRKWQRRTCTEVLLLSAECVGGRTTGLGLDHSWGCQGWAGWTNGCPGQMGSGSSLLVTYVCARPPCLPQGRCCVRLGPEEKLLFRQSTENCCCPLGNPEPVPRKAWERGQRGPWGW